MPYLIDSNVLLHLIRRKNAEHPAAKAAIRKLRDRGESLYISPQNVAEFWNGCTRPTTLRNGFGFTVRKANRYLRFIESGFLMLMDSQASYQIWRGLMTVPGALGAQVHDAKLASIALANGLAVLTFDDRDFARYPGLVVVHPNNV